MAHLTLVTLVQQYLLLMDNDFQLKKN